MQGVIDLVQLFQFLSTPSARRATLRQAISVQQYYISIHALREEGDHGVSSTSPMKCLFLSTPSARRATFSSSFHSDSMPFLSTPSARRATSMLFAYFATSLISIHALREEGDNFRLYTQILLLHFYPRPPRGGRQSNTVPPEVCLAFLSTPSARRATPRMTLRCRAIVISIHALREEGDLLYPLLIVQGA